MFDNIIIELALIFIGASICATIFLYFKQPIILAYISWGIIAGPWGLNLFENADHIENVSHLGIILLLFLIGLEMDSHKFIKLLKKTAPVTLITSVLFAFCFMSITRLFSFSWSESFIVGISLIFSSTVIGLKLIPTTVLHQKHLGEVMISVLLFQDIIAVGMILFLYGSVGDYVILHVIYLLLKTTLLVGITFLLSVYVVQRLFRRFDIIKEYLFIMALAWCFLVAEAAKFVGLSYEIGAFVAGISLATLKVGLFLAEELKPIREFFLILFFFTIGAKFDLFITKQVFFPGLILAGIILWFKPFLFKKVFSLFQEFKKESTELGMRLGQGSEFSLLVSYGALAAGKIGEQAYALIQLTVILTFMLSTYLVVLKYRTPISSKKKKD